MGYSVQLTLFMSTQGIYIVYMYMHEINRRYTIRAAAATLVLDWR